MSNGLKYILNTKLDFKKIIIKCVPKKYISQAIKYIKNECVCDNDLKFTDERQIAKYEQPLFHKKNSELLTINTHETCIRSIIIALCTMFIVLISYLLNNKIIK
jgi:hypothetical protein